MTVEIDIDLNSRSANVKLEGLRAQIESLSDELDIDIDTDKLSNKIDKLTEGLSEINIDVDYSDLKKAAALKAALEGDIQTEVSMNKERFQTGGDGIDPPPSFRNKGLDHYRHGQSSSAPITDRMERMMERMSGRVDGGGSKPWRGIQRPGSSRRRVTNMVRRQTFLPENEGGIPGIGALFSDDSKSTSTPNLGSVDSIGNIDGDSLKKKFRKAIPSMSVFYNLFAALIPVLVSIGTQLAGVAASMGSVALAGGSILALGLVGHGEDMASSWENAKKQLSQLKTEMFQTFQPTMQTFAPIQAEFFDRLPQQMSKVAVSMKGLTKFSDTLFASLRGVTTWIAEVFDVITANEDKISQLTLRFGELAGSSAIDFFQFIVDEAYKSQDVLIKLLSAFVDIIVAVYRVSKTIAVVISSLKPFVGILTLVSKLLNNKIVVAVLAFGASLGATAVSVIALVKVITLLAAVMNAGLISTILKGVTTLGLYMAQMINAAGVNMFFASTIGMIISMATLGVGALMGLAGAAAAVDSMSPSISSGGGVGGGTAIGSAGGRGSSRGGGTVINEGDDINISVGDDLSNKKEKGLTDTFTSDINDTRVMD